MQVKVETHAVMEAEREIRYSYIALLYRTIFVVFERAQAFIILLGLGDLLKLLT